MMRNPRSVILSAACEDMAGEVHAVIQMTINAVYPLYYPSPVVDIFRQYHSLDHITAAIAAGSVIVASDGHRIIGTGSRKGNHLEGVYVLPQYQDAGVGTRIIDALEAQIAKQADTVVLDASLPAVTLYENRGYRTVRHGVLEAEEGCRLVYDVMEKRLNAVHQ